MRRELAQESAIVAKRRVDMTMRLKTVTLRHGSGDSARAEAALDLADEGDAGVEALLDGLADGDSRLRMIVLDALAQVNWRGIEDSLWSDASALLASALADREASIRAGAARALGRVGGEAAVDALRSAAADPAESVRLAVAASLGRLVPTTEREWEDDATNAAGSATTDLESGTAAAHDVAAGRGTTAGSGWAAGLAPSGGDARSETRSAPGGGDESRRMIECPGCRRMAKPDSVRCHRCGSKLRP
jgi:hypothetical protein